MHARTSLCLALGLLVAALVCGNPSRRSPGGAASTAVDRAPPPPPDEVCPDPALQAEVVGFHRDVHGEARWRTRDGREWRRNPDADGVHVLVEALPQDALDAVGDPTGMR